MKRRMNLEQKFKLAFGLFVLVFGTWLLNYYYLDPALEVVNGKSPESNSSGELSDADRKFLERSPFVRKPVEDWTNIHPAAREAAREFDRRYPNAGKPNMYEFQGPGAPGTSYRKSPPTVYKQSYTPRVSETPKTERDQPDDPYIRKCGICSGQGFCTSCRGEGGQNLYDYKAEKMAFDRCKDCNGTGRCRWCKGTGTIKLLP